ncbi:MAG: hypothetical protein AB7V46_25600 [Thermomicrobiales bacterium]
MIIFIHDDDAYFAWLAAHRRGFVVNCHHPPTPRYLMLHRAACAELARHRQHGGTTDRYIKVCATTVRELEQWAGKDVHGSLRVCPRCRPHLTVAKTPPICSRGAGPTPRRLTKLGDQLLSFVLEVAVMSLDGLSRYGDDPPTVGALASYVGKSVHQIAPAIRRLLEDGFISVNGATDPTVGLTPRSRIYPTASSLRTVPAFESVPLQELNRALADLGKE